MTDTGKISGIIDIHAHILPGIDDGARNWEESKNMLKMASQQGISCIIATPHYRKGQAKDHIKALVGQLNQIAEEMELSLSVVPGQEIFYFEGFTDVSKTGEMLSLAGSRYVLVEFAPQISYQVLYQGIRRIVSSCCIPVVAHVERYHCLRYGERLKELTEAGGRLQMNYESLQGNIINADVRWCRKQIMNRRIHFLGTDMHHDNDRTPEISRALRWLNSHVGEELRECLMRRNPECILNNVNLW